MRPLTLVLRLLLICVLAFGIWRQCFAEPSGHLDLTPSRESERHDEGPGIEARRSRASTGAIGSMPPEKFLPAGPLAGAVALGAESASQYLVVARDGRGLPIKGAELTLDDGVAPIRRYETDDQGRVRVPYTAKQRQILELRFGELGCRHVVRRLPSEPLRLELIPSLDFSVQLRNLKGEALPGIRVYLRVPPPEASESDLSSRHASPFLSKNKEPIRTSDRDGIARFLVGRDVWDFAPGSLIDIVVDFVSGEETKRRLAVEELVGGKIEMALATPATCRFQVEPQSSQATRLSWMLGGDLIDLDRADDHRLLQAGEILAIHAVEPTKELRADFVLQSPGYETLRYPLLPLEFGKEKPRLLKLGPPLAKLLFRVRDRKGRPVVGVDFEARPPVEHDAHEVSLGEGALAFDGARRRVASDRNGCVIMELPSSWGRPRLRARVGQLTLPADLPALAAGETLDLGELVFEPGPLAVSGRVCDAKGDAVVGARARILSRDSFRDWARTTDRDGRFRIEAPLEIDDGKPMRLAIFADGYLAARPAEIYFGTENLRITLDRAAGCRGTIDFGNPILRREMTSEIIDVETGEVHTMIVPNLDGTFVTWRLPAGSCALRVRWNRDLENRFTETFPFESRAGEIVDLGLMKVARGYERSFIRILGADGKPDPYASFVLREEGGSLVIKDSMMPLSELPLNLPHGRTWSVEVTSIDQGSLKKSGLRPPFILRLPGE
jgi:hypothetical protein